MPTVTRRDFLRLRAVSLGFLGVGRSSWARLPDVVDACVIGSGFGGAMAAHAPVLAGARVLMLERGGWVERGPHNWEPQGAKFAAPVPS